MRRPLLVAAVVVASVVATAAALELALRVAGLGDPVLYDNRVAYGYRPQPNQTHRRLGGARVHVNALGVRGPDVGAAPSPDALRLLFLGDSVTWGGTYVDDDALFAAEAARVVAARGRRVEWLDAGVNGWGPENVLGFVRETGGFASHVWVVVALEDDLRREKTHVGEVPYFNVPPRFAWEELAVLAAARVLARYKTAKPAADLSRLADENLARYRAIAEAGRAAGARVLLVWHPTVDALASGHDPNRDRFLALADGAGTAALDLTPTYRPAGAAVYVDGMHLDVAGHRLAGQAIGAAITPLVR